MSYRDDLSAVETMISQKHGTWDGISADAVARMRLQNRFLTGLDIARYTAKIMRDDIFYYYAYS